MTMGVWVGVAATVLTGVAATALATDNGDDLRERARVRYEAGAAAFEGADYATALAEMEESYALFPSLRTLFALALCRHALFDFPSAVASLERYLAEGGDAVPAELRAQAVGLIEQMRRDMAHLDVRVEPAGVQVLVDGVPRGVTPFDGPLDVGPGAHVVELRLAAFRSAARHVTVGAARTARIEVTLEPEAPAVPLEGTLRVTASGTAARVLVDGALVGDAPVEATVAAGEHRVRVVAEGCEPIEQIAVVVAGETEELAVAPVPRVPATGDEVAAPSDDDWAADLWWVWTIVGVAVVGGAVTAGVLLWPEDGLPAADWQGRVR
jgi:hypothetical protein